jgi:aminomethyltransferase
MENRKTPFFELEKKEGAFFTEFAGWYLPLHFGSAIEEVLSVRQNAGFFDISHMGRVKIFGKDSEKLISKVFTRKLDQEKKGLYGFFVSEDAKIIDDVVVFKKKEDEFFLVVNASRKEKDLTLLEYEKQKNSFKAEIEDISDKTVFVAIQGPKSPEKTVKIISKFSPDLSQKIPELKRFQFDEDGEIFISRTGYTGEDGFEIVMPKERAYELWDEIKKEVRPCGLAARDILRLEAGLILFGMDLTEETPPPFHSHLERFISEKSERFEILKKRFEENPLYLKGIIFDSLPVPNPGAKTEPEGVISSAVFSAVLKKPIAFGWFKENLKDGTKIKAFIRNRISEGTISKTPFFKN